MPGLDQKATARHLRKAGTHDEVEEVLAAYLHSKQQRARNGAQAQRKLYLLGFYLQAVQLGPLVDRHSAAFRSVGSLAAASVPAEFVVHPTTDLGRQAWNDARRVSTGLFSRSNSSSPASSAASSAYEIDLGSSRSRPSPPAGNPFDRFHPPGYVDPTTGYVDRFEPEGRRRVAEEDERLPAY